MRFPASFLQTRPRPARPERDCATALNRPAKRAGEVGKAPRVLLPKDFIGHYVGSLSLHTCGDERISGY